MKTRNEILATEYHKKYPCSEFEFSDLGDKEHYLPIVENAMEEYSEEMACGFVEWIFKQPKYTVKSNLPKILYSLYLEHLNK